MMTEETFVLRRMLFISAVMELWRRGFDTWQIAKTLGDDQAAVERALHEGLELERKRRNHAEETS
jgi:hypothetical protein